MQKSMYVFDNRVEIDPLMTFCHETGVDTLILHPGFFVDNSWIEKLKENHIKIWLNFPVFFDEEYLKQHPEAYSITSKGNKATHSWLHMVCPSNKSFLEKKKNDFRGLLERVNPDYISYDFIRFFVFWEEVDIEGSPEKIEHGCYCPVCRGSFSEYTGERRLLSRGEMLLPERREQLGLWKSSVIEETVKSLNEISRSVAKNTSVYSKIVPWKDSDLQGAIQWITGQRVNGLKDLCDGLVPMAFTQILGQDVEWKKEMLDYIEEKAGKRVSSCIQFEPLIRKGEISEETLEKEIQMAAENRREGLVYFHYEQIMDHTGKQSLLKRLRCVGGRTAE